MGLEENSPDLKISELMTILLTHEEMENLNLPKDQFLEISIGGQLLGPIEKNAFKKLIEDKKITQSTAQIKQVAEKNWSPLFSHPIMKDLKNTGLDAENLTFHLMKNARKVGPYTSDEILTMIKKVELLFIDIISSDNGRTWRKVYDYDKFNRRKVNRDLPAPPSKEFLLKNNIEIKTDGTTQHIQKENITTLADLTKIHTTNDNHHVKNEEPEQNKEENFKKFATITAVSLLGLAAIYYSYTNLYPKLKNKKEEIKEPKVIEKPKTIPHYQRPAPPPTPTNDIPNTVPRTFTPPAAQPSVRDNPEKDNYNNDPRPIDDSYENTIIEDEKKLNQPDSQNNDSTLDNPIKPAVEKDDFSPETFDEPPPVDERIEPEPLPEEPFYD